jgi:hypothetical protein
VTKWYARSLSAVATAVVAAMLGVTAAVAATTWTVRPGGSISLKSGKLTVTDTKTGAMFTCASAGMSGTLNSGSRLPGTDIGSVTAAGITGCTPAGFAVIVTATDLPWHVNFSSYNATHGVVTGSVSHIQARLKVTGFSCRAVIDGTSGTASDGIVKVTYTNSTAALKMVPSGGNLHFYHVVGCVGAFHTGDSATMSVTFTVSPKQAITSP